MNIREIDGKAALSYFNASTPGTWRCGWPTTRPGWAPRRPRQWCATSGPTRWKACLRRRDNRPAQPYGGYIRRSTFDEVRVFVSQCGNTAPRDRIALPVIQFAVNPFAVVDRLSPAGSVPSVP